MRRLALLFFACAAAGCGARTDVPARPPAAVEPAPAPPAQAPRPFHAFITPEGVAGGDPAIVGLEGDVAYYRVGDLRVQVGSDIRAAVAFDDALQAAVRCGDGWLFSSRGGVMAYAPTFLGDLSRVAEAYGVGFRDSDGDVAWSVRDDDGALFIADCRASSPRIERIVEEQFGDSIMQGAFFQGGAGVVVLSEGGLRFRPGFEGSWRPLPFSSGDDESVSVNRRTWEEHALITVSRRRYALSRDGQIRALSDSRVGGDPSASTWRRRERADRGRVRDFLYREWRLPSDAVDLHDGSSVAARLSHPVLWVTPEGTLLEAEPTSGHGRPRAWGSCVALSNETGGFLRARLDGGTVRFGPVFFEEELPNTGTVRYSDDCRHAVVMGFMREPGSSRERTPAIFDTQTGEITIPALPPSAEGPSYDVSVRGGEVLVRYPSGRWYRARGGQSEMELLARELNDLRDVRFAPDGTIWGVVPRRDHHHELERLVRVTAAGVEDRAVHPGTRSVGFMGEGSIVALGGSFSELWTSQDDGQSWEPLSVAERLDGAPEAHEIDPAENRPSCTPRRCRMSSRLVVQRSAEGLGRWAGARYMGFSE